MTASDVELVARVGAADDRAAFAELVRRHQSAVRLLLRRLTGGDEALADDLAQETFMRAYRALQSFEQKARLSSWLYRIAYNVFAADAAKRRRRATDAWAEPPEPEPALAPASDGERAGLRHDLGRALARLSVAERAAIVLTGVSGLTCEEAAEVLGCPVGTVKTNIHRGRSRLRQVLEEAS